MSDVTTIVAAVASCVGAWLAWPVPVFAAVVGAIAALLARSSVAVVAAVFLLALALSHAAWAGLRAPPTGAVSSVVTLLTDPEPKDSAVQAEARLHHRHVELWAHGADASALRPRLAGERIAVTGTIRPVSPAMRVRLARRHIAAQIAIRDIAVSSSGALPARVANAVRRTLARGASVLPRTSRSLFSGFVLGDDREQPQQVTDSFRASGLTHLLVVSGENVAFVLLLAAPLLRRIGFRLRFAVGLVVLVGFGLITRWEPSVLRAEAMAALAMAAAMLGRQVSTVRLVALAVTLLVLVDPMLVRSVGFLMSVGACSGIALLSEPIARRLPGPRAIAYPAAVTIAAQLGVAPVVVPTFGPMPIAALPANLLAVPAAGPIMVWGMTGGVVAGVLPLPLAALLHVPTALLIAWVEAVARVCSRLPLGHVTGRELVAIAVVGGAAGLRSSRASRARRSLLRPHHAQPGDGDPQPHTRLVLRQGSPQRDERLPPAR